MHTKKCLGKMNKTGTSQVGATLLSKPQLQKFGYSLLGHMGALFFRISASSSVKRNLLRTYNVKCSDSIEKIGGYIFRKSHFRVQMRILNSLIVPETCKGRGLWAFWTSKLLQNIKQIGLGPFGDIKNFSKKC